MDEIRHVCYWCNKWHRVMEERLCTQCQHCGKIVCNSHGNMWIQIDNPSREVRLCCKCHMKYVDRISEIGRQRYLLNRRVNNQKNEKGKSTELLIWHIN